MRFILIILFFLIVGLITYGSISNSNIEKSGDFFIGIGTVLLFLIFIPLFLYFRRKKITKEKYFLTNESLRKMRENEKK